MKLEIVGSSRFPELRAVVVALLKDEHHVSRLDCSFLPCCGMSFCVNRRWTLRVIISTMTNRKVYPIPAALNLMILSLQVISFFGLLWATSLANYVWQIAALFVAFAILGNSIYSIIHEAEHGMLHPNRRINDLLGAIMAVFFPAPFHLIRQGHLGHHRRNRTDNEAFDHYFDGDRPWLKWLILYGILTGAYWILVVLSNVAVLIVPFLFKRRFFEFDRPSAAFMDALNPRYFWLIQVEAVFAIAFHATMLWAFEIPIWRYATVYFGFGYSWSAMQYVHHFGTERDVLNGARNLRFIKWIDCVWLYHNWHLLHHQRPNIPWIYLPRLSANQSASRESLIWHYFRMWRGPRYTAIRVAESHLDQPLSHSITKVDGGDV
jgi:fatty acid desaturase